VNSDDEQELARSFNIRRSPTLMLFREKGSLLSGGRRSRFGARARSFAQGQELDMAAVAQGNRRSENPGSQAKA